MGIVSKYNKGERKFKYQMPEDADFKNLKDLYTENGKDYVYPLMGMYISTKGYFGEQAIALCPKYFVNLPKHMNDTVKEMLDDEELISTINNGNVFFRIVEYVPKNYDKKCYSIHFDELEDRILLDETQDLPF